MIPILAEFAIIGKDLSLLENVKIIVDDTNNIIEIEESSREIHNNVALIPGFFNAHVHAADIGLRGAAYGSLDELVGKEGIKHRYLNQMSEDQLNESLKRAFQEAINFGILGWSDFREGGIDGLKPYPVEDSLYHLAFGRPSNRELGDISKFSNIGIMDVKAYSEEEIKILLKNINRKSQKLFIHASESLNLRKTWITDFGVSDIKWSLDVLKPDAIIHVTHANMDDIVEMSKTKTGAIICLRSNKFTKTGTPPVESLVESGLPLGIGTDNAMFNKLSLWDELHSLKNYIEPERLFSIATIEGAQLCGIEWGISKRNTNFLELQIPKHVQVRDLKEWIINNGTEKDILKIWR